MTVELLGKNNNGGGTGGISQAKETFQDDSRVPIIFCPPGSAGAAMAMLSMVRRAEGGKPLFPRARTIFRRLAGRGSHQDRKT